MTTEGTAVLDSELGGLEARKSQKRSRRSEVGDRGRSGG